MLHRRKRLAELRLRAERLSSRPVLLDGDADELLAVLRAGAVKSGIDIADRSTMESADGDRAFVVILAVAGDGRQSSFLRATRMLREMEPVIDEGAIRIVVVQSGRSRASPGRVQQLLGTEILFQVLAAVPGTHSKTRSLRQHLGRASLDASGLRVLRFA